MEQVLGTCIEQGIKVVTNAGGLNPAGCADEGARPSPTKLGLDVNVAHVEGDDLMDRDRRPAPAAGPTSTPARRSPAQPVTANAYLGGWGIAAALHGRRRRGGVPTGDRRRSRGRPGRVVARTGPPTTGTRLAGAVVAGHVIECGAQATGGNYSWFSRSPT